ncbi:MAG: hypothetical protein WA151_04710 [Desulfatirhabdiaceae bacterium]
MTLIDLTDPITQQFLMILFEQTCGDSQKQVSMYDIGALIGLDRAASSRIAELLMTSGMIEIRTLSGGIGLTADGASEAQAHLNPDNVRKLARLGANPVIHQDERESVEQVMSAIKNQVGKLGLDYDTLMDVMADLRTMDSQLLSSRAKTSIFRECLTFIDAILKTHEAGDIRSQLKFLLE